MTLHVFEVGSGEEVIATLTDALKQAGIRRGAIASVVGAVSACTLSNMPRNDAKGDILTPFDQPMEMSGTGEVKDGVPHIHCVVSGEGNAAIAGHLHSARVDSWFVNVYVAEM